MKKKKSQLQRQIFIPEEEEEEAQILRFAGLAETPFDPFDRNPNSTNKLDDFQPNPKLQ